MKEYNAANSLTKYSKRVLIPNEKICSCCTNPNPIHVQDRVIELDADHIQDGDCLCCPVHRYEVVIFLYGTGWFDNNERDGGYIKFKAYCYLCEDYWEVWNYYRINWR